MANSNTPHSKRARALAATENKAEKRRQGLLKSYSVEGKTDFILAQKEALADIPGKSYAEKIQFLLGNQK